MQHFLVSAFICYALCMLVGAVLDLKITNMVVNHNSIFGVTFQDLGLFPSAVVGLLAGEIMMRWAIQQQFPWLKKAIVIFGGFLVGGYQLWSYVKLTVYLTAASASNYQAGKAIGSMFPPSKKFVFPFVIALIVWVILMVLGTVLAQRWLSGKSEDELKRLVKVAVLALLLVFLAGQLNETMKSLWGRFRPYELSLDQHEFTSWFKINGPNGHKSFPSGHSEIAALALLFPLFAERENYRGQRNLFIFGVIYSFLMAASRVVIGAHYFSDTMTGVFTTFLVIYMGLAFANMRLIEPETEELKSKAVYSL